MRLLKSIRKDNTRRMGFPEPSKTLRREEKQRIKNSLGFGYKGKGKGWASSLDNLSKIISWRQSTERQVKI